MPEQLHEDLGVSLKAVIIRAIDEAARRGATKVEAEHLLLSIAASGDVAAGILADAGLDYAGVEGALRGEREHALRSAGVEPVAEERLRATGNSRPAWGASIREALKRGNFTARRDRSRAERERLAIADSLIGVLRADLGTVPRALAYAGVDRAALITRLEQL
ncbi:Clp protease N-terminal domain-containing protein [Agromyces albus]|uniref:Clp protease n=1 Tax=Agromyces albus TaxID=205332 RepID=A0A4Q2L3C9_9MICO|nr:Clp protease N-terminal domain-containing protein [Agromyces albus]RXZ70923.1 Clp protease [Agromyces albus]